MPHYRNGRPAREGDLVFNQPAMTGAVCTLGILLQITPGSTSCNGQLAPAARRYADGAWRSVNTPYHDCVTIGECALAAEDGPLETLPEGGTVPMAATT